MKTFDKESVLEGIRANLDTPLVDIVKEILELPEGESKSELLTITFSDIFHISSINSPDSCLEEMIKHLPLKMVGVSEIESLLRCNRTILTKTLRLLEMKGGMNGWKVKTDGERRGKKYTLEKIS